MGKVVLLIVGKRNNCEKDDKKEKKDYNFLLLSVLSYHETESLYTVFTMSNFYPHVNIMRPVQGVNTFEHFLPVQRQLFYSQILPQSQQAGLPLYSRPLSVRAGAPPPPVRRRLGAGGSG